jgi:hypothetical protein
VSRLRLLYTFGIARASGQPVRRHAWREAHSFIRTLCGGPDWNVKVRDDATVPFCANCLHIAREEIALTALALQDSEAAWEARKGVADRAQVAAVSELELRAIGGDQ